MTQLQLATMRLKHLVNTRGEDDLENGLPDHFLEVPSTAKDLVRSMRGPGLAGRGHKQHRENEIMMYRTTWLLPYLDVQTLAEEPLRLLSLLHYRSAHSP